MLSLLLLISWQWVPCFSRQRQRLAVLHIGERGGLDATGCPREPSDRWGDRAFGKGSARLRCCNSQREFEGLGFATEPPEDVLGGYATGARRPCCSRRCERLVFALVTRLMEKHHDTRRAKASVYGRQSSARAKNCLNDR